MHNILSFEEDSIIMSGNLRIFGNKIVERCWDSSNSARRRTY